MSSFKKILVFVVAGMILACLDAAPASRRTDFERSPDEWNTGIAEHQSLDSSEYQFGNKIAAVKCTSPICHKREMPETGISTPDDKIFKRQLTQSGDGAFYSGW